MKARRCERTGRKGRCLPGRLVRPTAFTLFVAACLLSHVLSDFSIALAQYSGTVEVASSPLEGTVTTDGSLTCAFVPCTSDGVTWGSVQAGQAYQYTASGTIYHCEVFQGWYPVPACPSGPDGWAGDTGGGEFLCPGFTSYSLVGKIDGGDCFQLGSDGGFIASATGTLQLYFNDDVYWDNFGWFECCINPVTNVMVDAQGFGPQLNGAGVPSLETPITTTVDASYRRVGALTDGASLIVVQLSTGTYSHAGWRVAVSDPDDNTLGAAQLGSLWHGDNASLPPLPATLNDPGTLSVTLGANEKALFYLPPPSWAFGSSTKTHGIQIQVLDQSNHAMVTTPFTLYKPPLVLVHGWKGNPGSWIDFPSVLAGAGIQVDTFPADYAACNTCGLDAAFDAVPKAISNELAKLRADMNVAATRVDVVAHSLGGIVTRWYMTLSSQLPDGQDRGLGANPALAFKVTTIKGTRPAEYEFLRPDNFGVGDIRRMITLGTPHTGTSAAWKAIQLLNLWVTGKAYRNRELRNDTMSIERDLDFQAIGLNEVGIPTSEAGMVVVDAAAFGTSPVTGTCGSCPDVSLALAGLSPVPVKYLPVEGTAFGNNEFWDVLVWIGQRMVLHGAPPSDIQPDVSDGFIPALSARNQTARRDDYNLIGVNHSQLTSAPGLEPILVDALGEDDSIFLGP